MKLYVKQMSKRMLAMTLSLLMLMSCWVFFEPIHVHAAKYTYTYTLEELYQTYLVNDITTVGGSFTDDSTINTAPYVNVLYSPAYTQSDIYGGVASGSHTYSEKTDGFLGIGNGSVSADIDWHHPVTTMLWDGTTQPQTGVMMTVDPNKSGNWDGSVKTERAWLSNNDLQFPSYWKGICGENLDFAWCMNQSDVLNYLSTNSNDNMVVTRKASDDVPVFGNVMRYTGTMNDSTYYVEIKPTFNHYGVGDGKGYTITATSSNSIYVINYKPLKAAITAARTEVKKVIDNPGWYSYKSVAELTRIANALAAARPNNYINSASNDVATWATDAKAAVTAFNSFSLASAKYEVMYENMFSITSWADSASSTISGGTLNYDVNAGTITVTDTSGDGQTDTYSNHGANGMYVVPVKPETTYVFKYKVTTNGSARPLIFDTSANLSNFDSVIKDYSSGSGTQELEFTTPAGCDYIHFRFGVLGDGITATYSDIALYEKSRDDAVDFDSWTNRPLKKAYTFGSTLGTSFATPERIGYRFNTWWIDTNGNGVMDSGEEIASHANDTIRNNITVYSDWSLAQYTITYDSVGGSAISAVTYNIKDYSKAIPAPEKTGYTFSHWEVAATSGNWTAGERIAAGADYSGKYGDVTLKAVYTNNKYTLNFDLNKPAGAVTNPECDKSSVEVAFDNAVGELPVPTVNGYTFAGWFNAKTNGTQVDKNTVYTTVGNSTVYAYWNVKTHNIITDANGGVDTADTTYTIEGGTIPVAPSRDGYTFSHWEVAADAGNWVAGTKYIPGQVVTGKYGDVTLKAVWTQNSYALVFDLNTPAGAVTEPQCDITSKTVVFDSAIGALPVPTLDGYEFAGWFAEAECVTPVNADTVYKTAASSSIYAKWTVKTYNIITDANTGDDIADSTYTIENGTIPAGGTKTGYTFSHWEVAENSGNWVAGTVYNAGDSAVGKYGDVTLKAIWTANKYTVNFELNDANSVSSATVNKNQITVTFDSAFNANEDMPVASRNGYTFLGWFTAPEGGEKVEMSTVYTTVGNSTLYAQWEIVKYTLSFNENGGNAVESITYTVEDEITLPAASRTGYTFTNWRFMNNDIGNWVKYAYYDAGENLGSGFWGDIELTAMYTINTYEITWIVDGEIIGVETYNYNAVLQPANPVKAADEYYTYNFKGWTPALARVTEDAIYTAEFEAVPRRFTVSWVADGVTLDSKEVGYGEAIPSTDALVPEKTGHTGAWAEAPETMPADDVVINAVYTPIKYEISWIVNGEVIDTDMVDYGTVPSYSGETPEKAADAEYTYSFLKWSPELVAVTGKASYTAEFSKTPNVYTITWIADGTTVATTYVAFGSEITEIPDVPAKIGYVGSWANIPEAMPATNVVITASYVKGSLVTWYLDGTASGAKHQLGFATGEQIVFDRSEPTKAADAEYTYKFSHWSETPDGAAISGYPVATDEDFTYYAVFEKIPNKYTITWIANGVTVKTENVAFGEALTVPSVPAKTGHTGEWLGLETLKTMPAKDVVVYAEYTPIDYTITWIIGDKTHITTFAYGTMPVCSESTYKASTLTTDYAFAGWDKNVVEVVGDETYTAIYTETARKYTVTWKYENGIIIESYKVANGAAITEIPAIESKEGHNAVYNVPEVMPTNDIEIIVKYEAKSYTITWVTPSGNIEESWKYGETPVYNTEKYGVPSKASTAEKDYSFSSWSPSIGIVRGDTTYTALFTETSRRYTVVWYVDGVFQETRDIAYGAIIPTLTIPEKEGYTAAWDNTYRTMPASDLVINAVYTAKRYTVYWKVDGLTVYSASVPFGSVIPEQKVPEKLGCTGVWVNAPETMPAQNITITAEYSPKSYNVTWRFNGVTTSDTATYGVDFVVTFEGAERPEELKITVGGIAITGENYTYKATDGILTIKGSAIIGDVVIIARAAGGNCNLILNLFGGDSTNNVDVIPERQVYFTVLVPYEGYLLPADVSVYVDGTYLAEGYTYDSKTGKLVINAEVIYGEIEVYADFPVDPSYDAGSDNDTTPDAPSTNCGCNCHSNNAFLKFFFDIITFLRQLFGMDQYRYCDCGAAHW